MNQLWLDIETTGLIPQIDHIIEIAYMMIDIKENMLFRNSIVLKYPKNFVVEPFIKDMHSKNNLLNESKDSAISIETVERELYHNLQGFHNVVLCGSSIHFDRSFLAYHTPKIFKFLSHKMIDVSSIKLMLEDMDYKLFYDKKEKHRAFEDMIESYEHYKQIKNTLNIK